MLVNNNTFWRFKALFFSSLQNPIGKLAFLLLMKLLCLRQGTCHWSPVWTGSRIVMCIWCGLPFMALLLLFQLAISQCHCINNDGAVTMKHFDWLYARMFSLYIIVWGIKLIYERKKDMLFIFSCTLSQNANHFTASLEMSCKIYGQAAADFSLHFLCEPTERWWKRSPLPSGTRWQQNWSS